jgi:hypothetical protein
LCCCLRWHTMHTLSMVGCDKLRCVKEEQLERQEAWIHSAAKCIRVVEAHAVLCGSYAACLAELKEDWRGAQLSPVP